MKKTICCLREVIRQRDMLLRASDHDNSAIGWMHQDEQGNRPRIPGAGQRRIWTRRDKRLFEAGEGPRPGWRVLHLLRAYERGPLREYFAIADRELTAANRRWLVIALRRIQAAHDDFCRHLRENAEHQPISIWWEDIQTEYDNALRKFAKAAPDINDEL